jgi:ribulose-5-phosphate 4-epimerase/fuculose-1-phosphate aldolase
MTAKITPETEGVVKYQLKFRKADSIRKEHVRGLEKWRGKLMSRGMIGQDKRRYDGYGFGNISMRQVQSESRSKHPDAFIITGTQTGHIPVLSARHYAWVKHCNIQKNTILSEGQTPPSSEAMTHYIVYHKLQQAQAVMHVHSPELWNNAKALGLATTASNIAYGTPQMADAIKTLLDKNTLPMQTIAMMGHEDGIITWGRNPDEAGNILIDLYKKVT